MITRRILTFAMALVLMRRQQQHIPVRYPDQDSATSQVKVVGTSPGSAVAVNGLRNGHPSPTPDSLQTMPSVPGTRGGDPQQPNPPHAPAIIPIQLPPEDVTPERHATTPTAARLARTPAQGHRPGTPSPLSQACYSYAEPNEMDDHYSQLTVDSDSQESQGRGEVDSTEEVMMNKLRGPSKREQRIVNILIDRGPRVIFVSLDNDDAAQFYNAVPESQKERVAVYPVGHDRSLVKWANTIREFELVDSDMIDVQTLQRWYQPQAPALPDIELRVSGERADNPQAYPIDNMRGDRDFLASDGLLAGPADHRHTNSVDAHQPDATLGAAPLPNVPHGSAARWGLVSGLVVLSTASAALGGLLAWSLLAYGSEPFDMTVAVRFFIVPLKLCVMWALSMVARFALRLTRGLRCAMMGYFQSILQVACSTLARGCLNTFELVLGMMIRFLNQLHDQTVAYSRRQGRNID